jgi:hypothetical protein
MTRDDRLLSCIILITVPTIQYGGYFLLTSLMDKGSGNIDNPLRQNFFRAGHAHAGVIVILSLVCQILADAAFLPALLVWFVRIGVPLSAILISAGFFFSMLPPYSHSTKRGSLSNLCRSRHPRYLGTHARDWFDSNFCLDREQIAMILKSCVEPCVAHVFRPSSMWVHYPVA